MIPEQQANNLLEELGIVTLPIDPIAVAEKLDVHVQHSDYGSSFEGMLVVAPDLALIGINSGIKNQHRRKFTCAHELGHFSMDLVDGAGNFNCSSSDMELFSKKANAIEVRANRFAAELLLPKFLVSEGIKDRELSWESVKNLALEADVSLIAAARKFIEHTDEACSLVVSENKVIRWFQSSPSFLFRLDMDGRLVAPLSKAHEMYTKPYVMNDFEEIAALSWIQSGSAKRDDKILEWSLPLDSYGRVLTLLWDDQGIAEQRAIEDVDDEEVDDYDPEWGWETPRFSKSKRKR